MKKLIALVLCLAALLCTALAEDTAPVFTEDFEGETHQLRLAEGTDGCVIEVQEEEGNKYLHVVTSSGEEANGYVQVLFGPEVRNFDLSLRVRPFIKNGDYNWMKVVMRALDGQSTAGYENEAYLFNIWEWRGCFVIKSLEHRQSESSILVENQDFWFDNGTWYTINVEARDTNFKVYVDGELCVEYTDEKDLRPEGIFTLCSWGVNFDVDDISIVSYDEPKAETEEAEASAEAAETETAEFDGNLLPLITAEAGLVEHKEDGSVRIAGRNADNTGDAYTDTWHILQRKVSDFELSFDYIPQLVEWNMDRVCFRCAGDENGWNQYQLLLFGSNHKENEAGLRLVKGEALDNAFAQYACTFEKGKSYEFKLAVKGNNVKVYMDEALVIDVDLPTGETSEYRDMYIGEGDFQFISWAGDFTMTHLDLVENETE